MAYAVEKAAPADLGPVVELVQKYLNPEATEEMFRDLFCYEWPTTPSVDCTPGFVLKKDGTVVGYLGLVLSQREGVDFVNLTTWVVAPPDRAASVMLLMPLRRELKDFIVTNLSPTADAGKVFKAFGFQPFENDYCVIPPTGVFGPALREPRVRNEVTDHQEWDVFCASIREVDVIYDVRRKRVKGVPIKFAEILWVSDRQAFASLATQFSFRAFLKHGAVMTICDPRYVESAPQYRRKAYDAPLLYRGPAGFDPSRIDGLYTEKVLLRR
jgi:hypothetical protein